MTLHQRCARPLRNLGRSRWFRFSFIGLLALFLIAHFSLPLLRLSVRANPPGVATIAGQHPNFTPEQRSAVVRQLQSTLHPLGRDLTIDGLVRRFSKFLAATATVPSPAADFTGNLTAVGVAANDIMVLAQQTNCSYNLDDWAYTLNPTALTFSYTLASSTPNVQQTLHSAAGLTTTQGNYPAGCGNTNVGGTSHKAVFTGVTTGNVRVYAGHFYDAIFGADQIFVSTAQANDTFLNFTKLNDPNSVIDLATSDLNGDGNGDLVSLDDSLTTGNNAIATVFLGNASGGFSSPTQYPLEGTSVASAVIDDFNGDGKKDLVISTYSFSTTGGATTYYINFLAGNGDGTFQPAQSYQETPPSGVTTPYFGLISADLRGSGNKDLITSEGIVLFGNGDGTFSQFATAAFPPSLATSPWGPNVVAADFNKDGKPDLAEDDGQTIGIFLGNGDGTFTPKAAYSMIGNVGYLEAQDIDGDGNIDLYSGSGNNGSLGGDQFDTNLGYALMGNGDGTFRGAPSVNFSYTGTNLGGLTGPAALDAVGVDTSTGTTSSFTSYLGDGKGDFTTGPTLVVSPITLSGSQYFLSSGIDSFALGDVNGDGFADLVYLGASFYGPGVAPGIFVATGNGDGSFNAPVFIPAPAFVQAPDIDVNPMIYGVRLADLNHDGKLDLVYTYNTVSFNTNTDFFGIAVQLGNGDGTFQTTAHLTQLYSGTMAPNPGAYQIGLVGNVNNDAFPDLLLLSALSANAQNATLQIFLGTGTGTFQAPTTVSGVSPGEIDFGTQWAPLLLEDMNKDGIPDLVALQPDPSSGNLQIAIALGNGNGTFKAPSTYTYANSEYLPGTGLAVADFSGDGNLDVATTSLLGPAASGISFGNGDGTLQTGGSTPNLTPVQTLYVGGYGAAIAMDLNGDGKPDILSGSVLLFNATGSASSGPASTTTTLGSSANPSTSGQQVTFTATVTSTGGTPAGSVTFEDGTTQLSTQSLNAQGVATYQTSSLSVASHSITAQYLGNASFAASTSNTVAQVVQAAPTQDFSITLQTTSLNLAAGHSGSISVVIAPLNGSTQTVTFSCNGLPAGATCQSSPVTLNGTASQTPTITLQTTARTASFLARPAPAAPGGAVNPAWRTLLLACLVMLVLLSVLARSRRLPVRASLACATFLLFGTLLAACGSVASNSNGSGGGSTGTPAGSYTITITGTSGTDSHTTTTTVALTVT